MSRGCGWPKSVLHAAGLVRPAVDRLALFHGPRCIARCDANGVLPEQVIPQAA